MATIGFLSSRQFTDLPAERPPGQRPDGRPAAKTEGFGPAAEVSLSPQAVERLAVGGALSEAEQAEVAELRARDREVRVHEQAHAAAGGRWAGSPSYSYQTGPDGQRYAVDGEVAIDLSPERDSEATIAKMQTIKRAAIAPAEPSSQDRSVARTADQREAEARMELAQEEDLDSVHGGRGSATVHTATAAYGRALSLATGW